VFVNYYAAYICCALANASVKFSRKITLPYKIIRAGVDLLLKTFIANKVSEILPAKNINVTYAENVIILQRNVDTHKMAIFCSINTG